MAALPAHAQQQAQQPQQEQQQPAIDVNKLPVSPARLQRKLQESIEREEMSGNTLRYSIDVFALAPKLELFRPEDNLVFGPARFGPPSNQDMINIMTPKEFQSPIMDFSNMFRWLSDRSKSEKK